MDLSFSLFFHSKRYLSEGFLARAKMKVWELLACYFKEFIIKF